MSFNPDLGEPVKIVNDNQQPVEVQNRAADTQNDFTQIKVTLYTIDNAIIKHLSDRIKPVITQDGKAVNVPVIYGDPERWKSAQRDGILRDNLGKIQLPIIMVRRSAMKKTGINSAVNKYYDREFYVGGWNRRTPYDRYAVMNGIKPSKEYYATSATPDYYEFTYKCMVWTQYMEQMNQIVENISFESDEFWGEKNSYKFRTAIDSFNTITQLPTNSDRVVRTDFDMKVNGYLLPESSLDNKRNRGLVTKKRYTGKRLVLFSEVEGTEVSSEQYNKTYAIAASTGSITEGQSVTFTITTTNVPDGELLLWTNIGTATSSDISGGVVSGEVEIINDSAQLTLTAVSDILTESAETLIIRITDPVSGGTATSPTVTINNKLIRLPSRLAAGTGHYAVLGSDNTLWTLGANSNGQLGFGGGSFGCYTSPTKVSGTWRYVEASGLSTTAVKTDGSLCMTGQLVYGDGILTSSRTFVSVDSGPYVTASTFWGHTLAIREDGTLWGAGSNFYGELGLENNTDTYTFTQIGTSSNWVFAHAGQNNSFAIDNTGSLWAAGYNQNSQLGLGDAININKFTRVGSDTDWVKVYGRAAYSIGLKNNGTLWWSGNNQDGECTGGSLPFTTSSVFVQVGTDSDWVDVQASLNSVIARKSNGTIYTWGGNNIGQLGNGTFSYYATSCTPFSVDSGSAGWTHITISEQSAVWAVKNNELYFWGRNSCSLPRFPSGTTTNPRTTPARYRFDTTIIIPA